MTDTMTPKKLKELCQDIYKGRFRRLSRTKVKTIMRPLYAPFHEIYPWVKEGSSLLDIGCGSGAFLLLANRLIKLKSAIGYDINKKAISLASSANKDKTLCFKTQDMPSAEDIKNASVISLIDVLHHIKPRKKSELFEHLFCHISPGTRLIIKDLDPKPRWRAFANRVTDALSTQSLVHYISMDELAHLLTANGCVIRERKYSFSQVWSHYILVADYQV